MKDAQKVKLKASPVKRPARSEWSSYVSVLGWRGISSVSLEAGSEVRRNGKTSLELLCELPEKWKPRALTIYVELGLFGPDIECNAVSTMNGDKVCYALFLSLPESEFEHLRSMLASGHAWQVSLGTTKPRYRSAVVHSVHIESASSASCLLPADWIVSGHEAEHLTPPGKETRSHPAA